MGELRGHFRPEFLNRVDDIVLFKPLTEAADRADRRAACSTTCATGWPSAGSTLELTEEARRLIARAGLRPGVRRPAAAPLHRPRGRDPIGRALLRGDVADGATIRVDVENGELVVTYENRPGRP